MHLRSFIRRSFKTSELLNLTRVRSSQNLVKEGLTREMSQERDLGSIGEPNPMSVPRDLAAQCARAHCVLLAGRVKVIRHNELGLAVEKIRRPEFCIRTKSPLLAQKTREKWDTHCGKFREKIVTVDNFSIPRNPHFFTTSLKRFLPLLHYLYVECIALD